MKPASSLFFLLALLFLATPVRAEELHELYCARCQALSAGSMAPMDSPFHRKYAPHREVDVLHLAIDVTPDFTNRTVTGTSTLRFKPIAKPLRELKLDGVDLTVSSVTSSARVEAYQVTKEQVIITFAEPLPVDKEANVTVAYYAEPIDGLYFRTPEMGYKPGEGHIFTQGEPMSARHWYPCYDFPNEKFTSEVTCRVPSGMVVLSNGRKTAEKVDASAGMTAVTWLQDKPHVNYLITLIAGPFQKIEDTYKDIPMAFWTLPSEIAQATNSFQDTKDMMVFFEREIGVPYPWAKYDQVCVNDFVAGGMENTSQTTLTDMTLFHASTENLRSSQGLVAHELAHQWFGDLVTCKDWSHLWLNEGFATYYDALYDGHKNGVETLRYRMFQNASQFLDRPNDVLPIVYREYDDAMEQFGFRAYPKGAWILHMLRNQLGEELFRQCVKTYLERHQYGTVVTEDLNSVIEELSGRSWDQFFDQWVYHAHHPELEVSYAWDQQTKLAKVSIKQVQKLSDAVLLFRFPLTVRFKSKGQTVDHQIEVKQTAEDFYFALEAAPEIVRVDPDYALLAKIRFDLPNQMLFAQLRDNTDMMGRLFAAIQLSGRKDVQAREELKRALNEDPFFGVRIEAAKALRASGTEEALAILIAARNQPDARVRSQVVGDIGAFYRTAAYDAIRQVLTTEKNPLIVGQALKALGVHAQPEVPELLQAQLQVPSYRNDIADAVIAAMKAQENPVYLKALLEHLTTREAEFTSNGFAAAIQALAYLARNETDRTEVRDFLAKRVNHPKERVQLAVINALGALSDVKAIPVLETFTKQSLGSKQRTAAERALADLRQGKPAVAELGDLRKEVVELQKTLKELEQRVGVAEKRQNAVPAAKGSTGKSKK